MSATVILYSDGGAHNRGEHKGYGAWCSILLCGLRSRTVSGAERGTTNNRMELRAVIEGLRVLRCPSAVEVVTDSEYVRDAAARAGLRA